MAFIITEYKVSHCCCSSQRDKEVRRVAIGTYPNIEDARTFIREWQEERDLDLTKKEIRYAIKKGILRPKKSCECNNFLLIDKAEPHAIADEEELFRVGMKYDDPPEGEELYDLYEKIDVGICCMTDEIFSRDISVDFDIPESKVKVIIQNRIREYTNDKVYISMLPDDKRDALISLIIQSGGLLKDNGKCQCKSRLVISGAKFPCLVHLTDIIDNFFD